MGRPLVVSCTYQRSIQHIPNRKDDKIKPWDFLSSFEILNLLYRHQVGRCLITFIFVERYTIKLTQNNLRQLYTLRSPFKVPSRYSTKDVNVVESVSLKGRLDKGIRFSFAIVINKCQILLLLNPYECVKIMIMIKIIITLAFPESASTSSPRQLW